MNRLMGLIEEVMKTAKALECRVHMAYNGSDICFTFSKGLISKIGRASCRERVSSPV